MKEIHSTRKILIYASIGNLLEFYDFSIYAFLIPIISPLFFPTQDKLTSVILGFSIFFIGFLARPLGSVILGYIGDKMGRRASLSLSLLGMALSTMLIAFLPTYAQIGICAPLALTFLRVFHGFCIGGEFIGSLVFLVEHLEKDKKHMYGALYTSWLVSSTILGWFLGAAVCYLILNNISAEQDSWRLPFMVGGLTGIVGYKIRKNTPETPEFMDYKKKGREFSYPPLKDYLAEYFAIFTIGGLIGALFYGMFIFPNSYIPEFTGLSQALALKSTSIGIGLYMLFLPLMGWLTSKLGFKFLMMGCIVLTLLLAYFLFQLLATGSFKLIVMAETISALLIAGFMAPASFIITQVFPLYIRNTSTSVSYNLGVCILGGLFPLASIALIKKTDCLTAPAVYLSFCALLAFFGGLALFSWESLPRLRQGVAR